VAAKALLLCGAAACHDPGGPRAGADAAEPSRLEALVAMSERNRLRHELETEPRSFLFLHGLHDLDDRALWIAVAAGANAATSLVYEAKSRNRPVDAAELARIRAARGADRAARDRFGSVSGEVRVLLIGKKVRESIVIDGKKYIL